VTRVPAFLGFALEGWLRAAFPLALAAALFALGARRPACAALALAVLVLLFFRDPERSCDCAPGQFLSPADGRIVAVDRVAVPEYFEREVLRISVFMNIFDVHVNRIPFDAKVVSVRHLPGRFLFADKEGAGVQNERVEVLLQDGAGRRALLVQVAGFVARRIVCRLAPGDEVRRGERFGLICFGSRVDLYLPEGYAARVLPGDRVSAGASVLGEGR
jgi:phosphatidylserine decarboxylase